MKRGAGAEGYLRPVTNITINSPVRWGGPDKRIRGSVNANQGLPIQATGATINSITHKRSGDEWQIASSTSKGDMILEVNSKGRAGKVKFAGVRDPLVVTGREEKIIIDTLLDDLMRKIIG